MIVRGDFFARTPPHGIFQRNIWGAAKQFSEDLHDSICDVLYQGNRITVEGMFKCLYQQGL